MLVLQRDHGDSVTINLQPLIDLAAKEAGAHADVVRRAFAAALDEQPARIIITNVANRGSARFRIGFEAPKCIVIHRSEVQQEIDGI